MSLYDLHFIYQFILRITDLIGWIYVKSVFTDNKMILMPVFFRLLSV